MRYTPHGKALGAIEQQLAEGRRYGRASVKVRGGHILHIWAYRAVSRRGGKSKVYNRYIFVINDTRIPASTAAKLMKENTNAEL